MEGTKMALNLKTLLLTMTMFKWGILCTATSDRCLSGPCQNGASCVDTVDDYACICPTAGVRYMGKNCDQLYDACFFAPCENCSSTPGSAEYRCVCADGLTGDNCTEEVDECLSGPCSWPRSLCVDQPNRYFCRCPEGFGGRDCRTHVTDCIDAPCENNGTCVLQPEGFECVCAPGFEGKMCEEDVDECLSEPCQNGAICTNGVAEFHCFCVPGFQGYNCELDINECASRPCENNATCINEKDHYQCECLGGFAGVNCERETDECESSPCRNGATCRDLVGMYACECVPGFHGPDCSLDVDECASEPCQNGAACHDMVNSYDCDCSETGFEGDHCETDVPECASNPCQHGGRCLEQVKGYACVCWPGYQGANCETDINECAEQPCENGECFERSDPSYWEADWEVTFADLAGYLCQCHPGFAGENCSVNIDECESEPCQNGATCEDLTNAYSCLCSAGFQGELCEVNMDECESQPCENGGWCEDGRASYSCHCPQAEEGQVPWGGQRCHVQLFGCVDHQCLNGAVCQPWLDQGQHGHTCLCPHGFYDDHCSTRTTFSFTTPGFLLLHVGPEDSNHREPEHQAQPGSAVQLRFRTTLPNMVVFFRGDEDNHLLLEIVEGSLHAKVFSEESEMNVRFPGLVSDGDWRGVDVFLEGEALVLLLKGPGCGRDGCRVTDVGADGPFRPSESFSRIYVGGAPAELLAYSWSGAAFIGCLEDLKVDSKPFLPQNLPEQQGPELGCRKRDWCEGDPCLGQGRCIDLWTSYRCDCYRPFYGHNCSHEFPWWTFSHEDSRSFGVFELEEASGSSFNVSFFLRSLKPEGLLLQLRRPRPAGGRVYFSVYLGMGRIFVSSLARGSSLSAPVLVTTGEKRLLRIQVQRSQVVFEHAGLGYGIGQIPEVSVGAGDQAFIGGLPADLDPGPWGGHYKGCLQDFRFNSVHLDPEAWGPPQDQELEPPQDQEVMVAQEADSIRPGCISDDTCREEPCLSGGECSVTFNDFSCSCPAEFRGKRCQTRVWCVSHPCVGGARCVDLPDGYECLNNATFDHQPVFYSSGGSLVDAVMDVYAELRTRSQNAVILRASWGSHMFLLGLLDASVRVEIRSGNSVETLTFTGRRGVSDGTWHRVNVSMSQRGRSSSPWVITVDGVVDASSAPQHAGAVRFLGEASAVVAVAESFRGCLGALRLGGVYLPFAEQPGAPQQARFHAAAGTAVQLGCTGAPVCSSEPCLNGGACEDQFDQFSCACLPGWGGERCQSDLDDCASQPCAHGSCRDLLAGFQCVCQPGFTGRLCSEDVDDCEDHACEHGGTCQDGVDGYTCACPEDYRGPRCQWRHPPERCGLHVTCANEGVCADGLWGANCTCAPGFTGRRCETEVNECESNPCNNGGSCLDRFNMFVCECPPDYSGSTCDINQGRSQGGPWLLLALPLLLVCLLLLGAGASSVLLRARRKRRSEGAYSPSAQEVAGARLEMDSMLKVPPEERLI